jgi:hypothetical protein
MAASSTDNLRRAAATVVPAGDRAFVIVNGRIVCTRTGCDGYQAQRGGGVVQLTVPGGRYDILVTD